MKSFSFVQIFLIIILVFAYQCSKGQDRLVTLKGDTITGDIKPLVYGMEKKIQITTADKKKTIYPMFQIKNYTVKGEKFQPVKGPTGYAFMKVLKEGYLSLYAFQPENQMSYDGLYLQKKDGSGTEVPNLSFKKIMKNFLSECPNIATQIDNGSLGKKDLNNIVDGYNDCIKSKSNEYTKTVSATPQPPVKDTNAWTDLEGKLKSSTDFKEKNNVLEMITEIRNKLSKGEKIPNFLIEGLKSTLQDTPFREDLNKALSDMNAQ
jgi:hypothetical protein